MRLQPPLPSGRAGPVLLEQRVHHESDRRQRHRHPAHHVSGPLQEHQVPLEQDHPRPHLQCAQALHGDEPEALRRVLAEVQDGAAAREGEDEGARRAVDQDRAHRQAESQVSGLRHRDVFSECLQAE